MGGWDHAVAVVTVAQAESTEDLALRGGLCGRITPVGLPFTRGRSASFPRERHQPSPHLQQPHALGASPNGTLPCEPVLIAVIAFTRPLRALAASAAQVSCIMR